jgi:hypothetical protein
VARRGEDEGDTEGAARGFAAIFAGAMGHAPSLLRAAAGALVTVALAACTSQATSGVCGPADQDGVNGGAVALDLTVDDTAFTPIVLEAQNLATVTLTLKNAGTKPHGFAVSCLATPNGRGCPTESCFPDAGAIAPIAPDASATATFVTPNPEGIYVFRSSAPGDSVTGQFVVQ